jgi:hypothetical protein
MPGFKDLSLFFDCRGHGSPKGEQQDVKMQEVLSPQMDPFFKEWKKTAPGADGYIMSRSHISAATPAPGPLGKKILASKQQMRGSRLLGLRPSTVSAKTRINEFTPPPVKAGLVSYISVARLRVCVCARVCEYTCM